MLGIVAAVKVDGDAGTAASIAALVLLVAAVVYFVYKYVNWATTMFVLTTDRIITRRGWLSKSGIEIPLERINTVFFNQRLIERMLGAGDLSIESAGERGTEHLTDIRKPALVQREIYVQMENNENRKFDRVRGAGRRVRALDGRAAREAPRPVQQGALTPAQYEAEKAKLLGS